jgi:hypothetical protein
MAQLASGNLLDLSDDLLIEFMELALLISN